VLQGDKRPRNESCIRMLPITAAGQA
jgi:hypothetical protein